LAASQYKHDRKRRSDLPSGPKPKDVERLLRKVDRDAESLAESLVKLQNWSIAPDSPTAPLRRPHLTWLYEFLVQNSAIGPRPDVDQSPDGLLRSSILGVDFLQRLITLSVAARKAAARLDKELIARTRSASDDSLYNLVWRCAEIWTSLKGRQASVNKVHRKAERTDPTSFCLSVTLADLRRVRSQPSTRSPPRTGYSGKKRPE
jgi:hypothetical protein